MTCSIGRSASWRSFQLLSSLASWFFFLTALLLLAVVCSNNGGGKWWLSLFENSSHRTTGVGVRVLSAQGAQGTAASEARPRLISEGLSPSGLRCDEQPERVPNDEDELKQQEDGAKMTTSCPAECPYSGLDAFDPCKRRWCLRQERCAVVTLKV